jgi:hypothetical protein
VRHTSSSQEITPAPSRRRPHQACGRAALVLDVEVYVDNAAGRLPVAVAALLDRSHLFHTSSGLNALALRAALNAPTGPDYAAGQAHYRELLRRVPESRVLAADATLESRAEALLDDLPEAPAQDHPERRAWLQDALAYLAAAEAGMPFLAPVRTSYAAMERAWDLQIWLSY